MERQVNCKPKSSYLSDEKPDFKSYLFIRNLESHFSNNSFSSSDLVKFIRSVDKSSSFRFYQQWGNSYWTGAFAKLHSANTADMVVDALRTRSNIEVGHVMEVLQLYRKMESLLEKGVLDLKDGDGLTVVTIRQIKLNFNASQLIRIFEKYGQVRGYKSASSSTEFVVISYELFSEALAAEIDNNKWDDEDEYFIVSIHKHHKECLLTNQMTGELLRWTKPQYDRSLYLELERYPGTPLPEGYRPEVGVCRPHECYDGVPAIQDLDLSDMSELMSKVNCKSSEREKYDAALITGANNDEVAMPKNEEGRDLNCVSSSSTEMDEASRDWTCRTHSANTKELEECFIPTVNNDLNSTLNTKDFNFYLHIAKKVSSAEQNIGDSIAGNKFLAYTYRNINANSSDYETDLDYSLGDSERSPINSISNSSDTLDLGVCGDNAASYLGQNSRNLLVDGISLEETMRSQSTFINGKDILLSNGSTACDDDSVSSNAYQAYKGGLWKKFNDKSVEYNKTTFYNDYFPTQHCSEFQMGNSCLGAVRYSALSFENIASSEFIDQNSENSLAQNFQKYAYKPQYSEEGTSSQYAVPHFPIGNNTAKFQLIKPINSTLAKRRVLEQYHSLKSAPKVSTRHSILSFNEQNFPTLEKASEIGKKSGGKSDKELQPGYRDPTENKLFANSSKKNPSRGSHHSRAQNSAKTILNGDIGNSGERKAKRDGTIKNFHLNSFKLGRSTLQRAELMIPQV